MSASGLSLAEIAALVEGRVVGDPDRRVQAVRTLDQAGPEDLSFLHNPKYVDAARASGAGALLVRSDEGFDGRDLVVCDEPYLGLARVLEALHPRPLPSPGIHPSAVVDPAAEVDPTASVGANAVVGADSRIAGGAILGAGCVLGREVEIGAGSELRPGVVIEDRCVVGARCLLHAGTVVGSDGYGFATVAGVHHKVPQVGRVVIEDDVEIGANCTIDRGSLGETRVGRGTKVDNMVQIAHNVQIGEHCLLVAQVGIAGSTTIGDHVVFAGHSGAAGHLEIGARSMIAAQAAVMKDLPPDSFVAGSPARPQKEYLKAQAGLRRLDGLRKRVAELEKRLARSDD